MIIEHLHLKAFGRFTDYDLDLSGAPRRLHLVYGDNESGKSTCLRAIQTLLFGFESRTNDDYVHKYEKLRIGATLIGTDGQRFEIMRRKQGKQRLFAHDEVTPASESQLAQMLGGIDEAAFRNRFGLSHEQMVEGGKAVLASKGEIGEILFAAGAGVGQLKSIRSALVSESEEIFKARGQKQLLNAQIKQLEQKRVELRKVQTLPAEYESLCQKLSQAEAQAAEQERIHLETNRSLSQKRSYRKACDLVPIWIRETSTLESLKEIPELDDDFAVHRREASFDSDYRQKEIQGLRSERGELQDQLDSIPTDTLILGAQDEVLTLHQQIAAIESSAKRKLSLVAEIEGQQHSIVALLRDLGVQPDDDSDSKQVDQCIDQLHVTDAMRIRIGELSTEFELVHQQEIESREDLQSLRRQLSDVEDELDRIPDAHDPTPLDLVLADIGPAAAVVNAVHEQFESVTELESQCHQIARGLRRSERNAAEQTLDQIVSLGPPTDIEIDEFDQRLQMHRRDFEAATAKRDQLADERGQVADQLAALEAEKPLPSEQELSDARQARDRAVDRLDRPVEELQSSMGELTREIRQTIHRSDGVVDTIRIHQTQVSGRASAKHKIDSLTAEIAKSAEAISRAKEHLDQCQSEWRLLWETLGVTAGSVSTMRRWIKDHQKLVDRFADLNKAKTKHEIATTRVASFKNRLASVVKNHWASRPVAAGGVHEDPNAPDELTFEALHDLATQLRVELISAEDKLKDLKRRRTETMTAISKAEVAFEEKSDRKNRWESDWADLTRSFGGDRQSSPAIINSRLEKVAEIFQLRRERDGKVTRIRSIDDEFAAWQQTLSAVCRKTDHPISDSRAPIAIARLLHERLRTAQSNVDQRESLDSKIQQLEKKLAEALAQQDQATTRLRQLCEEAGVGEANELPDLESQSARKRKAISALDACEQQLAIIAAGEPLDSFIAAAQQQDPIELDLQIQELEHSLEAVSRQREVLQQTVGALKADIARIDGGDRAAELNQELQFLVGNIARHAQDYAKRRIASMMLQHAIDHYRSQNESPVLRLACDAFSELTCEKYSGLRPDYDDRGESKLYGVQPDADGSENLVPMDAMSLGTADSVYLAMRLASLEHQLASGSGIPVVIDDCLIQLDDERTAAALKRLSKLSERTQVILFTHHRHLVELATEALEPDQWHLRELPSI